MHNTIIVSCRNWVLVTNSLLQLAFDKTPYTTGSGRSVVACCRPIVKIPNDAVGATFTILRVL